MSTVRQRDYNLIGCSLTSRDSRLPHCSVRESSFKADEENLASSLRCIRTFGVRQTPRGPEPKTCLLTYGCAPCLSRAKAIHWAITAWSTWHTRKHGVLSIDSNRSTRDMRYDEKIGEIARKYESSSSYFVAFRVSSWTVPPTVWRLSVY